MYDKIKKEVIELLKDKVTISWCNNTTLEDIFNKYGLFDNQKAYLDVTTRLCLELSESFEAYEIDDDVIFSTREINFYLHLGKLIEYLNNKEFTKEEMVKAIGSIGATFQGKPLSEIPIDKLYEIVYGNTDNGLVKDTMFIMYGK